MARVSQAKPARTPSIAARFATAAETRTAIQALENSGVDGNDIDLLESVHELSIGATKAVDWRIARNLTARVLLGVALGITLGALLGMPAAGLFVATTSLSFRDALPVCELLGVSFGGTLGAFVAFERSGTFSEAWFRTFEDQPNRPMWLGVYATNSRQRAHALRTINALHPLVVLSPRRRTLP